MKTRLMGIALAAAMIAGLAAIATPSSAAAGTCSVWWGSLPKEAAATATGEVSGVRTGRHTCFDRFVVDIADGDAPGYRVEYVDKLAADGSGKTVAVAGGAIIRVIVRAPAYDDAGRATVSPSAIDATSVTGYRTFRDIAWAGSFEGQTTIGLGVRARLPMRVFTLDGPGTGSRLVIDVAHTW